VVQIEFAGRSNAIEWVIKNQFGRRNLSDYQRGVLALRMKPIMEERARANQGERTDIRPHGGGYQIISGHHRKAAAAKSGIEAVPCWVREMDDETAYMALATSNSQGELSPLEIGLHALHCVGLSEGGRGKKGGLSAYAEAIGKSEGFIRQIRNAAKVAANLVVNYDLSDKTQHLSAIHALPESCWAAAVQIMLDKQWSAKETANPPRPQVSAERRSKQADTQSGRPIRQLIDEQPIGTLAESGGNVSGR